jgi:hypothetical protein
MWNIRRGIRNAYFKSSEARSAVRGTSRNQFITIPFAAIWTPQSLGGIGELPTTIIGASKDAIIYIWASRLGIYDQINDAAHALAYGRDDVNREIALALEASGQLDEYSRWLDTYVYKAGRNLRMKLERDRFPGIKLGDLDYEFSARRRIITTLKGSGKVNALAVRKKQIQASRLADQLIKPRVVDWLKVTFGWIDSLDFEFTTELPNIQPCTAVIGRDASLARFELALGFSTVSNDQRARLQKVFQKLSDNAFSVEAELGFDTLMALFTRPDVFPNVEKIASVAVRIGALPENAVSFAESFVSSFDSALIQDKGQKFSSGDEFGSTLDLSYSSILRVVDIPVWITDTDVHYLVRQLSIMLLLTTPINQPLRRLVVRTFGDSQEAVLHALEPRFNSPSLSFMNFIPVNTWY